VPCGNRFTLVSIYSASLAVGNEAFRAVQNLNRKNRRAPLKFRMNRQTAEAARRRFLGVRPRVTGLGIWGKIPENQPQR
jgi:hypothetical protein